MRGVTDNNMSNFVMCLSFIASERSVSFTFTPVQCSGSGENTEGSAVGVITMYINFMINIYVT